MIIALNKADRVPTRAERDRAAIGILSHGIFVSAAKREGLDTLLSAIEEALFERMVPIRVRLPYKAGDLMALLRREGAVDSEIPEERSVLMTGRLPGRLVGLFEAYQV
jgi:50S ribosomal subunit-associated GTPase HflX